MAAWSGAKSLGTVTKKPRDRGFPRQINAWSASATERPGASNRMSIRSPTASSTFSVAIPRLAALGSEASAAIRVGSSSVSVLQRKTWTRNSSPRAACGGAKATASTMSAVACTSGRVGVAPWTGFRSDRAISLWSATTLGGSG